MKPPQRNGSKEFEKVAVGEFIIGTMEVAYDQEHKFKGFQGKEDTIQPAVRFIFTLDGYKYKHYSRWMKFSYGEKANLYKKYVSKLVENAEPDMDFDLDALNGMKVKTIWSEDNDFQNIDNIFPVNGKIASTSAPKAVPTIDLDEPPLDETQAEELFDDSHLTAEGKKWAKK